jgi:FixJ family two-component response regulator
MEVVTYVIVFVFEQIPVVTLAGFGSEEIAVQALQKGAIDYIHTQGPPL